MASPLRVASTLIAATLLGACGSHAREGKPIIGPNVAVAKAYLGSISRPGESVRTYDCYIGSPIPILRYVILLPGHQRRGLLLIYLTGFIPRVQSATFDQASNTWQLRELPDTDWSFHHLPALRMIKYGSDDRVIQATFNQIMARDPAFSEWTDVQIASMFSMSAPLPWPVPSCL